MLEIRLFGAPEVLWNGAPLFLQRRANRALIYYLAAHGRAVERDALTELLWPGTRIETGRARLRETLSRLRDSLPDPTLISASPETVTLNFSRTQSDYLEFTRLGLTISNTPWRIPPELPLPPSLYEMMSRLTALYRLPGFFISGDAEFSKPLAQWRDEINTTARIQTLRILDRLYEHARVASPVEEALQWLNSAIHMDRFNEERQARFLSTLLAAGLKQEARQHYRALEAVYQSELDTPLPPEIAALRPRLFDESRPANRNVFTWPLRPTLKAPFVGRESNLADLRRNFVSGGGVLVFGEAGAGKTRLVQEFYSRLRPGPRLLMGVCRPMAANLPFQAWVNMLRRGIRAEEWRALPAAWARPLARLLPDLYTLRPDLEADRSNFDHPKSVLLEAIRQVLLVAAQPEPLIVFLDDVHWADETSLGLLAYLLEQGFFTGRHGFLILTSRAEEYNTSLDRLLSASYLNRINTIQISHLSPQEIGQMVHSMLNETPPPGFVERLAREVGGNPFAILETLGAFLDSPNRPGLAEITRLPLVSSVNQMIQMRLRAVSTEGRSVLHAAALYGGSLKVGMMSKVVALPEDSVARAFTELEGLRFIQRETLDGSTEYTFAHEKFRESLLQDISPAHNYLFNRRLAEVLEEGLPKFGLSQAGIIAQHFEAAGMFSQAFDYWVKAARYAQQLASMRESTSLYKRAERLIPRITNLSDEQLHTLFANWSDMAFTQDDSETLFRLNKALLSLGNERNSDLLIGSAYDGLGDACMASNQFEHGRQHVEKSLPHLEKSGNLYELLEAQTHMGAFTLFIGQIPDSIPWFERVLQTTHAATDPALLRARGNALYHLSLARTLTGCPQPGLAHARESMDCHQQSGWLYGRVAACTAVALACYYLGQYHEGYPTCREGIDLAERIEAWRMLGYGHGCAAHLALENGDLGAAWQHARQVLTLGDHHRYAENHALGYKCLGDIYLHLRAHEQALTNYQTGLGLARGHHATIEHTCCIGVCMAHLDRPEGLPRIQQSINLAEQYGLHTLSIFARMLQLDVLCAQEQFGWFEREAAELSQLLTEHFRSDLVALIDLLDACKQARTGQPAQALAIVNQVIAQSGQSLSLWPRLRACTMRLKLEKAIGSDPTAAQQQVEALLAGLYASLGDAPLKPALDQFAQSVRAGHPDTLQPPFWQ